MEETNHERHEGVRGFLCALHGKDPQPLRTYIEIEEAHDLMTAQAPGRMVFEDMDISGYRGKFRQGVEDSIRDGRDPRDFAFWYAARQAFLEYGGAYKKGMAPQGAY